MTPLLTVPLLGLCLLGAGWSGLAAARDRRPPNALLAVLLALEVLVLAQLAVAAVATARGDGSAVFIVYAVFEPLPLPVGAFWSAADRSRSSTLVITLACVAVAVMTLRMLQLWSAR